MNQPLDSQPSPVTGEATANGTPALVGTGFGQWMALVAALLGWMFDGAEMGVFSMVGRAAIQDLLGISGPSTPESEQRIGFYFSIVISVFLVGAATGGIVLVEFER